MTDEREAHEAFEQAVGGPEQGFRLMRLHTRATQITSGDRFRMSKPKRTTESVFRKLAKEAGYQPKVITMFLELP